MTDCIARGVNFVYAKEYVIRQYGADGWERIAARLPAADAEVWRAPVTLSTYPFTSFKALVRALAAEPGGSNDEKLATMYAYIADRSLNSLYKVFFRLANPAFVIGNYPKLWSRFFTAGTVQVADAGPDGATVRFIVPAVFLDWLPAACLGYSSKAVELAGGRLTAMPEVGRSEGAKGEWTVTYQLRWRA